MKMPCSNCLNRRDFLARAAGIAGAAALVTIPACGDGVVSAPLSTPRLPPGTKTDPVTIKVSDFPALKNVGVLVKVATFYAAKRTGTSTFDAFSMACTHEGCLTEITGGQQFDCPCHFSRFDINGKVVQGPATRDLQTLAASYDPATDTLTIG